MKDVKVPTIAELRALGKPLDIAVRVGRDEWGDPELELIDTGDLIAVLPCGGPTSTSYRRARVYAAAVLAVIGPAERARP